jgi:hypothetical protein
MNISLASGGSWASFMLDIKNYIPSIRAVKTGPRKPPIEVGNVKSGFLQKFIQFSHSFIHVS